MMNAVVSYPGLREEGSTRPAFLESTSARLRRVTLGTAYALKPKRLSRVPLIGLITLRHLFKNTDERRRFPASPLAYGDEGLVGICNDLSVENMLRGYRQGFFPFSHVGPMKWWSPDVRAVMDPQDTPIPKNVRRLLRRRTFRVTFDRAFDSVIKACAEPRPGKTRLTWITPEMMGAFWDLHEAGHAHSVEVWDSDDRLVGGLYGLAIGGVFFGESHFSRVDHASKVASIVLNCHLHHWGFGLRDGKWLSPHLESLGFELFSREGFKRLLSLHTAKPGRIGRWEVDEALDVANWNTTQES